MLISKVIRQLQKIQKSNPKAQVCLYDWRKNLGDDTGDGSSAGIYPKFEIELHTITEDEAQFIKENTGKKFVPWVAIGFENQDYNNDGLNLFEQ